MEATLIRHRPHCCAGPVGPRTCTEPPRAGAGGSDSCAHPLTHPSPGTKRISWEDAWAEPPFCSAEFAYLQPLPSAIALCQWPSAGLLLLPPKRQAASATATATASCRGEAQRLPPMRRCFPPVLFPSGKWEGFLLLLPSGSARLLICSAVSLRTLRRSPGAAPPLLSRQRRRLHRQIQ